MHIESGVPLQCYSAQALSWMALHHHAKIARMLQSPVHSSSVNNDPSPRIGLSSQEIQTHHACQE